MPPYSPKIQAMLNDVAGISSSSRFGKDIIEEIADIGGTRRAQVSWAELETPPQRLLFIIRGD